MTLHSSVLLRRAITHRLPIQYALTAMTIAILLFVQACPLRLAAQAAAAPQDVLVLSNGDTLHGKFVDAIDGKVTFHCDPLGDLTLEWAKIKELAHRWQFCRLRQDREDTRKERRRSTSHRHARSGKQITHSAH